MCVKDFEKRPKQKEHESQGRQTVRTRGEHFVVERPLEMVHQKIQHVGVCSKNYRERFKEILSKEVAKEECMHAAIAEKAGDEARAQSEMGDWTCDTVCHRARRGCFSLILAVQMLTCQKREVLIDEVLESQKRQTIAGRVICS